jgi:hypothetical protein
LASGCSYFQYCLRSRTVYNLKQVVWSRSSIIEIISYRSIVGVKLKAVKLVIAMVDEMEDVLSEVFKIEAYVKASLL